MEALGMWARATEGKPPTLSSQVKPEVHTVSMPTNKAQNHWDQLNDRLQKVCVCVLNLFAEACYCLEEEAVYFSYQVFVFFPSFIQKQSNLYRLTFLKEVYWNKLPQDEAFIFH